MNSSCLKAFFAIQLFVFCFLPQGMAEEQDATVQDMPVYRSPLQLAEIHKKGGQTRGNIHKFFDTRRRGKSRGNIHKFFDTRRRGKSRGNIHKFFDTRRRGKSRGNIHKFFDTRRRGKSRGNIHKFFDTRRRGKSRGAEESSPAPSQLDPLAPGHTGFTTNPQPCLFFYISGPWPHEIEFVLDKTEGEEAEPVYETRIIGIEGEGIYPIDLAKAGIVLEPDTEYEWFLTIVLDEAERSADMLTSAAIRYVQAPEALSETFENTAENRLHYVYAEEGYWYDAIANVSQLADTDPGNLTLRAQRAALLRHEQVSLHDAAACTR